VSLETLSGFSGTRTLLEVGQWTITAAYNIKQIYHLAHSPWLRFSPCFFPQL